ncbi:MAG: 7-carboxy-7-deazaguanine synthase [Methanonatronarchaeales archaeon]|nr:7-carboxy-7-deazaguanine synthase [Methanonatronarchaeales archaeon]
MRVSEIFTSIQGESRRQGERCTFVRLYGCDMRCSWCDTMYAVEGNGYSRMAIGEAIEEAGAGGGDYVCVTGGEPLLRGEGRSLVRGLLDEGFDVDVETNGAHPFSDLKECGARIVMDVKTPSSGEQSDHSLLAELGPADDVKFVIGDEGDLDYAERVLLENPTEADVFMQPRGGRDGGLVEELVERRGLDVKVQVQLHKVRGLR